MNNNNYEKHISSAVIRRLPRYFRYLRELIRNGIMRISSRELSERMNVTASQIRQDLNCFGGFGQQGYGYNVKYLYNEISHILGVDREFNAVIVGMGHLGHALAGNPLFEKRGIKVCALFDVDRQKVGTRVAELTVMHMDNIAEFCRTNCVDIAVLAIPKNEALNTITYLAELGIRGFWNFSNAEISLPDLDIAIENVHLGDSLMTLCYELTNKNGTANNGSTAK